MMIVLHCITNVVFLWISTVWFRQRVLTVRFI